MTERSPTVSFRSEDDDSACFRLSFERDRSGSGLDLLRAAVKAPDLQCNHAALSWNGDGLGAFFQDLARDWRGWEGTRTWDALEHGMSIEATHLGRVVKLLFVLRRDYKPDAWELRLPIEIAPGESLARAASEIESLFRATADA